MRLDQLVYAKYPEDVQMREAVRRQRRAILREARMPLSGAYWWVPSPDGTWDVLPFYDVDYKGFTPHDKMWRNVLDHLAILWKKDPDRLRRLLADDYTGLPRGRVSRTSKEFILVHGNDGPEPVSGVVNVFNLKSTKHRVVFDEHETMLPGHPERVQQALGVDLGLKGSAADFGDWDDEEVA